LIPPESFSSLLDSAASTESGQAFDASKPPLTENFVNLLTPDLFTPKISSISSDLYKLLALIERFDDIPNISPEFWSHLPLQTFHVGYRLCTAVPRQPEHTSEPGSEASTSSSSDPPQETAIPPTPLQESTRLAILLFYHSALVKSNPHFYMIHHLVHELQRSLVAAEVQPKLSDITSNTVVLLWILFAGALGSRGQVTRSWFVSLIDRMAGNMGLAEWQEVKETLGQFLWLNKELNTSFLKVWTDVERDRDGKQRQAVKVER
jgi:hypothetical protein